MHIHALAVMEATLRTGAVYKFKHPLFGDDYHYFVVVNRDPQNDENIIFVCATSQIEKREAFVRTRHLNPNTLVRVSPTDCSFLSVNSIFDCNSATELPTSQIKDIIEGNGVTEYANVSDDILQKIKTGIQSSPLVRKGIKTKI